jgi:hypothetical protein
MAPYHVRRFNLQPKVKAKVAAVVLKLYTHLASSRLLSCTRHHHPATPDTSNCFFWNQKRRYSQILEPAKLWVQSPIVKAGVETYLDHLKIR